MAVFIELQTDAFREIFNDQAERAKTGRDFSGVRRPFRGIETKDDTYAIIKVITANGIELPLVDSGGRSPRSGGTSRAGSGTPSEVPPQDTGVGTTTSYSNFILTNVIDARQEKAQIMETFGDPYVFFFGERPRVVVFRGMLVNTRDFNWRAEFWHNYETFFRGTKLVENNARLFIFYDDIIVEGYVLAASASDDATLPHQIPFEFQLFMTNYTNISMIGSTDYPVGVGVDLAPLSSAEDLDNIIGELRAAAEGPLDGSTILESSTDQVRRLSENSFQAATNSGGLLQAIRENISSAGANTESFLRNARNFFYGRRMRVPAGAEGSDRNIGDAAFANALTLRPGGGPNRTLPIRSKITDNYDEYINVSGSPSDTESVDGALLGLTEPDWDSAVDHSSAEMSGIVDPWDGDSERSFVDMASGGGEDTPRRPTLFGMTSVPGDI